jgi:signal transduction histidine kinase
MVSSSENPIRESSSSRPSGAIVFAGALLITGLLTWVLCFAVSSLESTAAVRVLNSNACLLACLVAGLSIVIARFRNRTRRFFNVLAVVSILIALVHSLLLLCGLAKGGPFVIAFLWLLPLSTDSFIVFKGWDRCRSILVSSLIAACATQFALCLVLVFGSMGLLQWLVGLSLGAYVMVVVSLLASIAYTSKELDGQYQELTKRLAALEGANEGLEAFVRSASHDLKAPLRHIATFCGFVQNDAADRLTQRETEDLERVTQSANHMTELVSSLLDFAKLGSTSLERSEFSLSEVVKTVVVQLTAEQQSRVVYGNLATIHADPKLLTLVMQNLVENALKYVRVQDPPVEPQVIVQTERTDNEVIVRVADNGTGMERRQWERVFEPGVRGVEQGEVAGTGYGLASCKRIIAAHGGRIWVDSEVGKGSTFHFTLPHRSIPKE